MHKISKILIQKLTKEELTDLCGFWDDGTFAEIISDELLAEDAKNFPEIYTD